jgi:hypothetical protein
MPTEKSHSRHPSRRWEIVLGILFVFSFLGVTFALTIGSSMVASMETGEAVTTTVDDESSLPDPRASI